MQIWVEQARSKLVLHYVQEHCKGRANLKASIGLRNVRQNSELEKRGWYLALKLNRRNTKVGSFRISGMESKSSISVWKRTKSVPWILSILGQKTLCEFDIGVVIVCEGPDRKLKVALGNVPDG